MIKEKHTMTSPKTNLNVEYSKITKQYRKELLIRRNSGKNVIQNYIKKIQGLFCIKENSIRLLTLYESDNIYFNRDYNKKYNIIRKSTYLLSDFDIFYKDLIERLEGKDWTIFIDYDWKICGALVLTEKADVNLKFGLGKNQINNEIHFVSTDQKQRILLDYTKSDNENIIEYIVYDSDD